MPNQQYALQSTRTADADSAAHATRAFIRVLGVVVLLTGIVLFGLGTRGLVAWMANPEMSLPQSFLLACIGSPLAAIGGLMILFLGPFARFRRRDANP